jgi:hypothetical protein
VLPLLPLPLRVRRRHHHHRRQLMASALGAAGRRSSSRRSSKGVASRAGRPSLHATTHWRRRWRPWPALLLLNRRRDGAP